MTSGLEGLTKFHYKYFNEFNSFWKEMDDEERRNMILVVCPFIPISRTSCRAINGDDVSGAHFLFPEFNLEDISKKDGTISIVCWLLYKLKTFF
jgi:hypothetical protein